MKILLVSFSLSLSLSLFHVACARNSVKEEQFYKVDEGRQIAKTREEICEAQENMIWKNEQCVDVDAAVASCKMRSGYSWDKTARACVKIDMP